jgi:CRISPR-associated protein Csx3
LSAIAHSAGAHVVTIAISIAPASIHLQLGEMQLVNGLRFQKLTVHLNRPDRLIQPDDLAGLSLPAGIDTTAGVLITGRAPIWLYTYLVHELHPTAWVACFDPRLGGAVVVTTHSRQTQVGQVIALPESQRLPRLGAALMVVGPPDSGKSVFSHALFRALLPQYPDVFLQRAQWDGEGNWMLELPESATTADREAFKLFYKGGLTAGFFPYQAQAILQLRRRKPLVIVDVGGLVQPEKVPVLEACSHYLVISSKPDRVEEWHEFCGDRGNLKPVAVVHSTLETTAQIHRQEPYLEITCGTWVQGQAQGLPEVLIEQVRSQF